MMAIVAPLLFLIAFGLACFTIAITLASHGGKMMAALRMDAHPRRRRVAVRPATAAIRPAPHGLAARPVCKVRPASVLCAA